LAPAVDGVLNLLMRLALADWARLGLFKTRLVDLTKSKKYYFLTITVISTSENIFYLILCLSVWDSSARLSSAWRLTWSNGTSWAWRWPRAEVC
jgi:hypothetical protein